MQIRKLVSAEEQAAFVAAFLKNDGSHISSDYLQQGSVWGFYQGGRLVAGFIINRSFALRYLEHFTKEKRSQLLQRDQLSDVVEITCIWHERNSTFSVGQKTELYVQSILKAINWQSWLNNAAIMGGSFNEKVAKRQKTLLRKQLFKDTIEIDGTIKNAQIYYARTRQVVPLLPLAIGMMIMQETKKAIINQLWTLPKKWLMSISQAPSSKIIRSEIR